MGRLRKVGILRKARLGIDWGREGLGMGKAMLGSVRMPKDEIRVRSMEDKRMTEAAVRLGLVGMRRQAEDKLE